MKYKIVHDKEWVSPIRKGYKLCCCDCGLVHKLDFRLVGGKNKQIQFRAERDERASAQIRRWKKEKQ